MMPIQKNLNFGGSCHDFFDLGSRRPSRRALVQKDSISTVPVFPVAQWRKLDQAQSSGFSAMPRLTGFKKCMPQGLNRLRRKA
jgi:hypothetical protein